MEFTGVIFLYIITFLSVCIDHVFGRGRLMEPPMRSSLWRYPPWNKLRKVSKNLEDSGLNCGGFWTLHGTNDGKCGLCGDAYNAVKRENEAGGRYALGLITRKYYLDQTYMNVTVKISSNIGGYFEFYLCPVNNVSQKITKACLDKNPMTIRHHGKRYSPDTNRDHNLLLRIPNGLTCTQCVLQWKWVGSNNWGICSDGYGGIGCGDQEEYYNCADIAILPARRNMKKENQTSESYIKYFSGTKYLSEWKKSLDSNTPHDVKQASPNVKINTTFFTTTPVTVIKNTPRMQQPSMQQGSYRSKSKTRVEMPKLWKMDARGNIIFNTDALLFNDKIMHLEKSWHSVDLDDNTFPKQSQNKLSDMTKKITTTVKRLPATVKPNIPKHTIKTYTTATPSILESTSSDPLGFGLPDVQTGWSLGSWTNKNPAIPLPGLDFEEMLYLLPLLSTSFTNRDRISDTMQVELLPYIDIAKTGSVVSSNSILDGMSPNISPDVFDLPPSNTASFQQQKYRDNPKETLFRKAVEHALKRNVDTTTAVNRITGVPVTVPINQQSTIPPIFQEKNAVIVPKFVAHKKYHKHVGNGNVSIPLLKYRLFHTPKIIPKTTSIFVPKTTSVYMSKPPLIRDTTPNPTEILSTSKPSTKIKPIVARILSSHVRSHDHSTHDHHFIKLPKSIEKLRRDIENTGVGAIDHLSNLAIGP